MAKKTVLQLVLSIILLFASSNCRAFEIIDSGCVENPALIALSRPYRFEKISFDQSFLVQGKIYQPSIFYFSGQCQKIFFYLASDTNYQVEDCCGRKETGVCCSEEGNGYPCPLTPCDQKADSFCRYLAETSFGATQKNTCSAAAAAFYKQVKFFGNSNAPDFKKIGEAVLSSSGIWGKEGCEFKTFLKIPKDFTKEGPARLYIEYSGVNPALNGVLSWRWLTGYQKINLARDSEAGKLDSNSLTENFTLGDFRLNFYSPIQPDYCDSFSGPNVILSWDAKGMAGEKQVAYHLQIFDRQGVLVADSGKAPSPIGSYATPIGKLAYGNSYNWQVRVWGDKDHVSEFFSGPSFTTPLHAYPKIDFSYLPKKPLPSETVLFLDESSLADGIGPGKIEWFFEGGDPETSNVRSPKIKFIKNGRYKISLRVTDESGFSCEAFKEISVSAGLPEW